MEGSVTNFDQTVFEKLIIYPGGSVSFSSHTINLLGAFCMAYLNGAVYGTPELDGITNFIFIHLFSTMKEISVDQNCVLYMGSAIAVNGYPGVSVNTLSIKFNFGLQISIS